MCAVLCRVEQIYRLVEFEEIPVLGSVLQRGAKLYALVRVLEFSLKFLNLL